MNFSVNQVACGLDSPEEEISEIKERDIFKAHDILFQKGLTNFYNGHLCESMISPLGL